MSVNRQFTPRSIIFKPSPIDTVTSQTAYVLYYCNTEGWKPNSYDPMSSFSALTLLVGSFDPQKSVPDMTYDVFGGTLNLAELHCQQHDRWHFFVFVISAACSQSPDGYGRFDTSSVMSSLHTNWTDKRLLLLTNSVLSSCSLH